MTFRLAAVVLLAIQAAPAQQTQAPTGSIAGQVVHAITGAPIAGARVSLMRFFRVSNEFAGAEPAATTGTDAQGRFVFRALAADGYAVRVDAAGFIVLTDTYLPPGSPGSAGAALIQLAAGAAIGDLVFRATPAGIITGRILDSGSRPIAGASVAVFRKSYSATGGESFGSGGEVVTDARGEYRLSVMPHDGYYLVARVPPGAGNATRYGAAIYPGTTDIARATAIDVGVGATARANDLTLVAQRLYNVRGRVVDAAGGAPPRNASVWITTTSLLGGETITGPPAYDPANGMFEIRVGPGEYSIGVSVPFAPPSPGQARPLPSLPPAAPEARVVVSNADVSDVVLRLVTPAVSIRGRLSVDGQPLSSIPGWDAIRVQLVSSRDDVIQGAPTQVLPQAIQAMPDGTFQLFGQMLGEFKVCVSGLRDEAYVQSVRYGTNEVLGGSFRITEPTPDTLEIVLNPRGGRIDGTVSNETSQSAAPAIAVLVPAQRSRRDLFARVTADGSGHFTFRGVAPGRYIVFASPTLEPFAYFDDAFLKRFDAGATAVQVTESARVSITVRLIRSAGTWGNPQR